MASHVYRGPKASQSLGPSTKNQSLLGITTSRSATGRVLILVTVRVADGKWAMGLYPAPDTLVNSDSGSLCGSEYVHCSEKARGGAPSELTERLLGFWPVRRNCPMRAISVC